MMDKSRRPPLRAYATPRNGRPSNSLRSIAIHARYDATAERIFNAWLDADIARRWLFATASRPNATVEIDARVAGTFRIVERRETGNVEYRGEYSEIVPYRRLAFSLVLPNPQRAATRVSVDIHVRAGGCSIALTHDHVPPGLTKELEARWSGMLYGLGETLDAIAGDSSLRRPIARHGPLRRAALGEGRRL